MAGPKRTPKKRPGRPQRDGMPVWVVGFLIALRESANIRRSCEVASVARSTFYARREKYPAFAAKVDEAMDDAIDTLEQEARRRGMEGVVDDVYHQGEVVGKVRKYSDVLLMFLLNAHRPEKFRSRHEVIHKGDQTTVFIPDMGGPTLTEEGD